MNKYFNPEKEQQEILNRYFKHQGTERKRPTQISASIDSSPYYMEDYFTEAKVKVESKEEVKSDNTTQTIITIDNYKEFLKELSNSLVDLDIDYFLSNHPDRVKSLSKNVVGNMDNIFQYLKVIGMVEFKIAKENWDKVSNDSTYRPQSCSIKLRNNYNPDIYPTYYSSVKFLSTRLPYCCGVSEYGEFSFSSLVNLSEELTNLKFNLFIDFIRLHSMAYRNEVSGAYSIINYYVKTDFTKALEKRDDITFIKEFKNPKTGATLKTFVFDSLIQ